MPRLMICIPCYNEERKLGAVLRRIPREIVTEVVVVDDGSTDRTAEIARAQGATVLQHLPPRGVGSCIWQGISYAQQQGAEIIAFVAGNDKDAPEELARLIKPIQEEGFDLVQGSRYLKGGRHGGPMPRHRVLATKVVHPWIFYLASGRWITDTTNGFRALRLSTLKDKAIDLSQPWLRRYELEPYLLYKVVTLGHRVTEVPVTKIYPAKGLGYTKMRPGIDWWSIIKPLVLLPLGLKR